MTQIVRLAVLSWLIVVATVLILAGAMDLTVDEAPAVVVGAP